MALSESVKNGFKTLYKSPVTHAVVVIGVGEEVFRLLDLVEKIPDAILAVLRFIAEPDQLHAAKLEVSPKGRILIVVLYFLLVAVCAVAAFLGSRFLGGIRRRIETTFGGYYLKQADDIYRFVHKKGHKVCYSKLEREVRIRANYDVASVERVTVSAHDTVVYSYGWRQSSDQPSPGFSSVKFSAKVIEGDGKILSIPAIDEPRRKRALILFVPPIGNTDSATRVDLRSEWPKASRKLEKAGVPDLHSFEIPRRLAKPLDELHFTLDIDLPGKFEFREDWGDDPGTVVVNKMTDKRYELEIHNVPPGVTIGIEVIRLAEDAKN